MANLAVNVAAVAFLVIVAWCALSVLLLPVWIWVIRRRGGL